MKLISDLDANGNYLQRAKLQGTGGNLLKIDDNNQIVDSGISASEIGSGTSADYSTQMAWVNAQMQGELQEQANSLFSVTTNASGENYWADVVNSTTLTVTVTVRFDGANVQPDNHDAIVAAGWSNSATGVYTKELTGASGSIAAQAFTYTPQSGTYQGITVSKSSAAKSILAKYPAYYGFSATEITPANYNGELTRITAKLTQTADLNNTTGSAAHLYILTHSTATATQSGNNILNAPESVTLNGMSGYKMYVSTNSAAANGKFGDVALTINV